MKLSSQHFSSLPPFFRDLFQKMSAISDLQKYPLYIVGGVVRDLILNRPIFDADFMSEGNVELLVKRIAEDLKVKMVSHPQFLTFSLIFNQDQKVDVVTAREESYPKPAQLPIVKASTVALDLKRRDFSINAIACSLNKSTYGEVLDPFGGLKDLENKQLCVLHDLSFQDDPTRVFRAARFAGRLGLHIEEKTERLIFLAVQKKFLDLLSPVRRRHELEYLFKEQDPRPALFLLKKWGALAFFIKEDAHIDDQVIHQLPVPSQLFSASDLQLKRLGYWFGRWGKDKTENLLHLLQFEKTVKKKLLSDKG
ncbi:MAG: CCA tRNA nucleotidyltransferase [Elusimicrobiota bacterium]